MPPARTVTARPQSQSSTTASTQGDRLWPGLRGRPWEAEVRDDPFRGAEGCPVCLEQSRRDTRWEGTYLVPVVVASGDVHTGVVHTGAHVKDPSAQAFKLI